MSFYSPTPYNAHTYEQKESNRYYSFCVFGKCVDVFFHNFAGIVAETNSKTSQSYQVPDDRDLRCICAEKVTKIIRLQRNAAL